MRQPSVFQPLRLGLALLALAAGHPGSALSIEASPVLRSVQDAAVFDDVWVSEALEDARLALGTRPVTFMSLTPQQALTNLDRFVDLRGGKAARAALEGMLRGRTALEASEIAAGAVVQRRPVAALQALLFAHRSEPRRAAHLINIAGLASALGSPNEALALLTAAETLGGKPRAALLNNRGRALILLGRYPEAEVALREAVKLDAWLSEAKRNLALVLYMQKKTPEAVRFMRAGQRRSPGLAKEAADKPLAPATPEENDEGALSVTEHWAPAPLTFDLSRARDGRLPALPFPKEVAGLGAYAVRMQALRLEYAAQVQSRTARLNALTEQRQGVQGGAAPDAVAAARGAAGHNGSERRLARPLVRGSLVDTASRAVRVRLLDSPVGGGPTVVGRRNPYGSQPSPLPVRSSARE